MKSVVQRVLGEFIDAGRLGKTELDEAAQGVLEKMEAKVCRAACSGGRGSLVEYVAGENSDFGWVGSRCSSPVASFALCPRFFSSFRVRWSHPGTRV